MHRRESAEGSSAVGAVPAAAPMPKIRLGSLEVSRFILGTNPFFGYAHQPGTTLDQEMRAYYSDERIMAVMDEAASYGITAVAGPPDRRWLDLWQRYRDGGGRLRHYLSQPHRPPEQTLDEIRESVEGGASAVFIQGHRVEVQFEQGTFDVVAGWVDVIRGLGVPAGLASHRPDVLPEAQRRGFPVDFYCQCFYNIAHGDVYTEADRRKAVETIARLDKPVVAYKILGAGRQEPQAAFAFALKHLRPQDGFCVGIYTKERPNELREDVALALG